MTNAVAVGRMSHVRHAPVVHRFGYGVDMTLIDLDTLPTLFEGRWFWSTRRTAWARWKREDYLGPEDVPLKTAVLDRVRALTGRAFEGRVLMLTTLRRLGHAFNPVTFYWVLSEDGNTPAAFLAEITNTPWSERHAYAFAWDAGEAVGSARRFRFPKVFHVSPFFPMDLTYVWTIGPPERDIAIHMEDWDGAAKVFDADLRVRCEPMTGRSLARSLLRAPATSLRVLFAIYVQALLLKLKGAPFFDHPKGGSRESVST